MFIYFKVPYNISGPAFPVGVSCAPDTSTLLSLPVLLLEVLMGPTEGSIFLSNYRTGVSVE